MYEVTSQLHWPVLFTIVSVRPTLTVCYEIYTSLNVHTLKNCEPLQREGFETLYTIIRYYLSK